MFGSEAGTYLIQVLTFSVDSWFYPETWKGLSDKHFSLLVQFVNYGREKFHNIGFNLSCLASILPITEIRSTKSQMLENFIMINV